MALQYSPKIVQDSLVMCLDASQNKSYPATDLPVKNGLVMWMDAADDTTFSYSSGTSVSQWRDKSGFNYHMVPKSSGPTRNAFLNSRKALAFTTSQTIGNDTINLASSANTVFVVSRLTGVTNGRVLTCNLDSGGNNWLLGHHGGTSNAYYAEGWVYDSSGASTSFQIYMGDWSGSSTDLANFYINGTAYATNNTAASAGPNKLGINYYSIQTSTCEAAEIIVFNRVLSAVERRLVHTYLGQKWGISNTDRSIIDLSNNNNDGLLGNGTTADMPLFDVYNKGALKLDGSTDYVAVANATSLNPTTVTVSIWVKRNGYQSQTANYLRRNYNDAYGILGDANADNVRFRIHNGSTYPESPNATLSLNEWTNIVGTYDLANIKIYKNGVFIGQTAHTSAISYASANTTLTIGRDDPIAGRYMNANYGSVLIYSRALSAAEVAQNYEAQKSKFANTIVQQGLVLNLDAGNPYSYAGADTTWYDVSGVFNNFTSINSPIYSADQFILNGTTQYFSISAASGFFSAANNFYADAGYAWTISVWFKFPVSPTSVRDATINGGNCSYCMFGNSGGIGGGETLSLFVSGISGTTAGFHPYYCIVGLRGAKTQLSIDPVNTNVWNNVVVTWNGSAGRGYFNGVDRGALNNNVGAGLQASGYTIGATASGASAHLFEGSISQIFVYSRAISAAEVLQNYNATKGRFGL